MISNRVWKFGDNINTDILAPGVYIKLPIEELASHCLESIDPSFSSEVSKGDIIVAGNKIKMWFSNNFKNALIDESIELKFMEI